MSSNRNKSIDPPSSRGIGKRFIANKPMESTARKFNAVDRLVPDSRFNPSEATVPTIHVILAGPDIALRRSTPMKSEAKPRYVPMMVFLVSFNPMANESKKLPARTVVRFIFHKIPRLFVLLSLYAITRVAECSMPSLRKASSIVSGICFSRYLKNKSRIL